MIHPVTDPDDPRIAAYRDIKERDLVGRQGLFVAEGRVVLGMLLASPRFAARSLLVAAHRVESLADLIARVPDGVPVYAADQPVLNAIAGFAMHRGILAIGARRATPSVDALLASLPDRACVVALSGIANHDNMGGIFRNAAAFGADAVVLDADCCDPLYRKAIRVSVGAVLTVPFAVIGRDPPAVTPGPSTSLGSALTRDPGSSGGQGSGAPAQGRGDERSDEDLIGLLRAHRFNVMALSLTGERTLAEVVPCPRTALLFGAEGPGLPPAMLARASGVRIPMAAGFDSLNVATTSGIVLHHVTSRSPANAGVQGHKR